MQAAGTKSRCAQASFEKASAKKLPLNSGGNSGSASLEACVPNAPSCCTPVGSPDAPHRRDNLCPPGTDTAAADVAAGGSPVKTGAPWKRNTFLKPSAEKKKTRRPPARKAGTHPG